MILYCVENMVNGKRYIGISSRTLNRRWRQHKYDARRFQRTYFHRAIARHGENNFVPSILAEVDTKEDALKLEQYFIRIYGTHLNYRGYNSTLGGEGCWGTKQSAETIAKRISKTRGQKRSEEVKKILSDAKLGEKNPSFGKRGPDCHNFGLIRSNETKEKIRAARAKQVIQSRPVPLERREQIRRTLLARVEKLGPAWKIQQAAYAKLAKPNYVPAQHTRWHINRGIVNPNCPLCVGAI